MSKKEPKIKRNFSIEKNTFNYLNDIQKENANINSMSSADRNTQIVMEMLNGFFIKNNVGFIATSDVFKAEGLELAEEAVRKRISKSRVRKLDNE